MSGRASIMVTLAAGVPAGVTVAGLRALLRCALAAEGRRGALAVGLIVTDDATIQALHAQHMGLDEPTDVLTFALDEADDGFISAEPVPLLGEIVVSYETAARQAGEYGQTAAREVAFLALHGLLHLLGYDDLSEPERTTMLARQTELLRACVGQATDHG